MQEQDVPTPALIVDLGVVQNNIDRMATYCDEHNLKLRPHSKTHKSVRIARTQMDAGACGLAVAKAGEAAVMAEACDDLMVAYPAFDPPRVRTIAGLARHRTIRVALDCPEAVYRFGDAARSSGGTIGVLVDYDTGMHRTGVQKPEQTLLLAEQVDRTDGVRLDGLFTYQGNVRGAADDIEQELTKVASHIQQTLDLWAEHGLEAQIVSGGSTPTAFYSHHNRALTEIRPGTFIYYDRNGIAIDICRVEDCAARILATVVSNAVPGKVILDAGNKTLAMDQLPPGARHGESGHGLIVEYPQATIDHLTEEHGRVDITACDLAPKLAEQVHVIPNHICVCVNLQNDVWFKHEDGTVEKAPVDARGLLS